MKTGAFHTGIYPNFLAEAGIPSLPLKGAVLRDLYPGKLYPSDHFPVLVVADL